MTSSTWDERIRFLASRKVVDLSPVSFPLTVFIMQPLSRQLAGEFPPKIAGEQLGVKSFCGACDGYRAKRLFGWVSV